MARLKTRISTEEITSRLLTFAFDESDIFACTEVLQSITKEELESLLCSSFCEERIALSVVYPTEEENEEGENE